MNITGSTDGTSSSRATPSCILEQNQVAGHFMWYLHSSNTPVLTQSLVLSVCEFIRLPLRSLLPVRGLTNSGSRYNRVVPRVNESTTRNRPAAPMIRTRGIYQVLIYLCWCRRLCSSVLSFWSVDNDTATAVQYTATAVYHTYHMVSYNTYYPMTHQLRIPVQQQYYSSYIWYHLWWTCSQI